MQGHESVKKQSLELRLCFLLYKRRDRFCGSNLQAE